MSTKSESVQGNALAIAAQQFDGVAQEVKSLGGKACSSVRAAAVAAASTAKKGAYGSAFGISYGLVASGKAVAAFFCEKSHIRRGFVDGAESALGSKKTVKKPARKSSVKTTRTAKSSTAKPSTTKPATAKPAAAKTGAKAATSTRKKS